jgi:hypothetical protein
MSSPGESDEWLVEDRRYLDRCASEALSRPLEALSRPPAPRVRVHEAGGGVSAGARAPSSSAQRRGRRAGGRGGYLEDEYSEASEFEDAEIAEPLEGAAPPPPPSFPYKVDTSRPSLRTNWTRLVPFQVPRRLRPSCTASVRSASATGPRAPTAPRSPPALRRAGCRLFPVVYFRRYISDHAGDSFPRCLLSGPARAWPGLTARAGGSSREGLREAVPPPPLSY